MKKHLLLTMSLFLMLILFVSSLVYTLGGMWGFETCRTTQTYDHLKWFGVSVYVLFAFVGVYAVVKNKGELTFFSIVNMALSVVLGMLNNSIVREHWYNCIRYDWTQMINVYGVMFFSSLAYLLFLGGLSDYMQFPKKEDASKSESKQEGSWFKKHHILMMAGCALLVVAYLIGCYVGPASCQTKGMFQIMVSALSLSYLMSAFLAFVCAIALKGEQMFANFGVMLFMLLATIVIAISGHERNISSLTSLRTMMFMGGFSYFLVVLSVAIYVETIKGAKTSQPL